MYDIKKEQGDMPPPYEATQLNEESHFTVTALRLPRCCCHCQRAHADLKDFEEAQPVMSMEWRGLEWTGVDA